MIEETLGARRPNMQVEKVSPSLGKRSPVCMKRKPSVSNRQAKACSNFSGFRNSYNKIIYDLYQKRNTSPAKIIWFHFYAWFSVYLHAGYPVHPQKSPYLPLLRLSTQPQRGHLLIFFAASEGFFISFARHSKIFWFILQSFSARWAPVGSIW